MKAIILAAGFATRLYPLTLETAKPLLDIGGRAVLSWVIDRIEQIDAVDHAVVVTNGKFADQFVGWRENHESRLTIDLINDGARDNEQRLGAIADLALGFEQLHGSDDPVVVVAGDNLLDFSLAPFAAAFQAHGQPMLLCRRVEQSVPPSRYGEVTCDGHGIVTRFREKPTDPQSDLVATCIYLFPRDIREDLNAYLDSAHDRDAPGHFMTWLALHRELRAEVIDGRMFDIGNRESLEVARAEFGS